MATDSFLQRPNPLRPFASNYVAPGRSNWGTGVQPDRRTTDEINAMGAAPAMPPVAGGNVPDGAANRFGGRNLGTLNSAGLNRPGSYPLGFNDGRSTAQPRLTQTPDLGRPWGQPNAQGGQNLGTLTSDDLDRGNAYAQPSSFLTRAPQQTERANPLTGDNNSVLPGQSVPVARPPFVQRGGLPRGQDVAPAPIRETMTEDSDINRSMNGTYGRLRGVMGRSFADNRPSAAYMLTRAMVGS